MIPKQKTIDGCTATAHIAYALSDASTIYPITPASNMGELVDQWAAQGLKNLMGQTMTVHEMESELGAAGAVHGCLSGGALTTTFTASQGLLLMIPNMYKISGELLPGVFHVTARSISTHALSIFGDHQDVMACRHTGFAFMASSTVQECMDLALVTHLSAIEGSLPFCLFSDGWTTSSEIQKISMIEYEDIRPLVNWEKVRQFRDKAMNPEHPQIRGTAQNPDVYFQNREAANLYYDKLPSIVEANMQKVAQLTGRTYNLFDYVGASDAEYVVISMASSCNTLEEVVNYLNNKGKKTGLIKVRLYRPFSVDHFIKAIPKSARILCVLDRTKEPGANGEPLYQDVCTSVLNHNLPLKVIGGRYGLSSKEFTPSMAKAVYDNMESSDIKNRFTIGIEDDVSNLSLTVKEIIQTTPPGTIQCKFFGFGSDGTVGANRQALTIIGDNTDLNAQAFFYYDSKKSGGYTVSHLRFGKNPIQSSYLITNADYIACHKATYVDKFDILENINEGGVFVLNSSWSLEDMEKKLPADMRRTIAQKKLKFYNIDAFKVASQVGLGVRINMIMQTVFFKLSEVLDFDKAISLLKDSIQMVYASKGQSVIQKNFDAIDKTIQEMVEIKYPDTWLNATDVKIESVPVPEFISTVARPIWALNGDSLPVSKFVPDGFTPSGTTAYEKRGVAISIPEWDLDKCIQCCQCSFVCPHAAIRPYLPTPDELKNAPASFISKKAVGGPAFQNLNFKIQVYPEDCQGCASCVNVCPGKALTMTPIDQLLDKEKVNLDFAEKNITLKEDLMPATTVKGSQLQQPLLEFSGACAGCGETPYVKLITQLFGERLVIANATGCSSIWGATMPSMPYTKNKKGFGPAWGNSLFEDAAEYGYGIHTGIKQRRLRVEDLVNQGLTQKDMPADVQSALQQWLSNKEDPDKSFTLGRSLTDILKKQPANPLFTEIIENEDLLGKKSVWIVGGDGWAYDIGFGGLDHVLASGENINVLVLDTECYSNTGGQTSKATPLGAIAKFASIGKRTNKKYLGRMFMTYGNIYVASIALGANKQHAVSTLLEAEAYDGPSIVIAYCPCINHGIKKGMDVNILEEAQAVASGYWSLYRYNPELTKQGKDPLIVDYGKPDGKLEDFLEGEDRYAYLEEVLPDVANELHKELSEDCDNQFTILTDESKIP